MDEWMNDYDDDSKSSTIRRCCSIHIQLNTDLRNATALPLIDILQWIVMRMSARETILLLLLPPPLPLLLRMEILIYVKHSHTHTRAAQFLFLFLSLCVKRIYTQTHILKISLFAFSFSLYLCICPSLRGTYTFHVVVVFFLLLFFYWNNNELRTQNKCGERGREKAGTSLRSIRVYQEAI